jgi:hypothetical protein
MKGRVEAVATSVGRAAVLSVMGALALTALLVAPAAAEPPQNLGEQVTDLAGVLGNRADDVQQAVDRLLDDTGVQLFVVYVDSFDGVNAQEWADETAAQSQLGIDDAVLAVAVGDRAYAYSVPSEFPLDDDQLADVARSDIEPALRDDDWAGAGIAAADGYREAITGGGSWAWVWWVLLAGAALVGGYLIWTSSQRKKAADTAAAVAAGDVDVLDTMSEHELRTIANGLLIETDDAIKTSEQELGFAQAEFGDEPAAPFVEAIAAAKAALDEAFRIQQQIDDDQPETDDQRRAMLRDIIEHCTAANDTLDAQAAEFDRLRDLEATVPDLLASLPGDLSATRGRIDEANTTLAGLTETYSAAAVSAVADNPEQAAGRLDFAEATIAEGNESLAGDRRGEAVIAATTAQDAIGQAAQLLDAVDRRATDLSQATQSIPKLADEVESEVSAAKKIPEGDVDAAPAIAAGEAALESLKDEAAVQADPLAAANDLTSADDALDQVLATAQAVADERDRAAELVDDSLLTVRSEVEAADDFITTRRGAVGSTARTRLADAKRLLKDAEKAAHDDPTAAMAIVQQAHDQASEALRLAKRDVTGSRLSPGSSGGIDVNSALLGGMLIDAAFGDKGGRTPSRGSGGGSRPKVPASFGGASTRARRGGGGRF